MQQTENCWHCSNFLQNMICFWASHFAKQGNPGNGHSSCLPTIWKMARAANGPVYERVANGPVFERAADGMFRGWISPSRYEPLANVENIFKKIFELKAPLGGNKSEWKHLALLCWYCIFRQIFPYVSTPSFRRDWQVGYTLRNFSCMVTTSCMSVSVSDFGAEWLVGGNVICNVLMACNRCFFIYVPNHNRFISKVEGFTLRILGSGF